ncbi:MAG: hypothetical protein ABI390_01650 [Daejeonella sp.]
MFDNRIYFGLAILVTFIFSFGCGTKRDRPPARVVTIAINIKSQNNHDLNFVDMNYYRLKVLDYIDDFLSVDLDLVEPDENPELVFDLNIDNFTLWPRDEQTSRRSMSRTVQVGTDNAGKPVYQTVTATVDITQIQRRSNARFNTLLTFKGDKPKTYKQSFSSNFNYTNTYVDNIRGDQRAVDPRLYSMQNLGIEPREDDFLLELSKRDMLPRISNELRSYYK